MFQRFIALGDSMTEGMNDLIVDGKFRGWADRVADVLATREPEFTYVNLAVRGKLVGQVVEEQLPVALKYINDISVKKILFSFHAGANDVLRPKYDPEIVITRYNQAVAEIAAQGVRVMLFCVLEDFAREGKTGKALAERFRYFNENVRKTADEVGAILLDPNPDPFWRNKVFMSWDRLHMNELGHYYAAQGVLAKLELPHDPGFREAPSVGLSKSPIDKLRENAHWFVAFLLPWIWRRLRGRSSGDGRVGKYLSPTRWPIN
jgi:lysophospholipase L1-like esterase